MSKGDVSSRRLLSEKLRQELSGFADTVLDQGETDAQNFGDFPLLAFLEEKEHRGGLNLRRQDAKGVLQVQAGVQGVQRAVRRFGQVGKGEFRLPTVMVPAQVPGNDIEIVGRFAVVLVSVQGGEEPGKGLLGEVLRVVDFLEVVVAVLQDAGVVFPNKAFDGLFLPRFIWESSRKSASMGVPPFWSK